MGALRTKTVIAFGFGAILLLMSVLILAVLQVLDASNQRLEQVVHSNNTKTDLIVAMRTAARERTVSLSKMLMLDDPFALDAEWMRFVERAGTFIEARLAFEAFPAGPTERALLERQAALAKAASPVQREVAQLILEGRREEARTLLLEEVLPAQDRTFAVMSDLLQIQKDMAAAAVREARSDYRDAVLLMLAAGAAVALLCLWITVVVIRRTGEIEHRLRTEKDRAEVTLHSIGDGVITTDAIGRIQQLNATAEVLTGWGSHQARGKPLLQVLSMVCDTDRKLIPDPVSRALRGGTVHNPTADVLLRRRDGMEFAIEFTAAPIVDRWQNSTAGTIFVFRDVTATRALATQLAYQARHDSLTGLINRHEFEVRLQDAIANARRAGHQAWLCYIDLDQFKLINDTCGHLAGDELLKQIAGHLEREVRDTDLVARMGGDEFALLLRDCDRNAAREIVERIRSVLQELRFPWEGKFFTSSASIGVVPITAADTNLYELLSAADKACYVAKDRGRNRVHVYLPDDDAVARHEGEMEWVHRIRSALEEERLTLYYQPIRDVATGSDAQCEILLRMRDERGQLVPPMAFIPAAERYGLMVDIDRWVVRTTLSALRTGPVRARDAAFVAINLSAQSLSDEAFLPFVLTELRASGLAGQRLCFEITETAAIANLARAQELIRTLKAEGCRFALDDFGSGLSSFGYLKTLDVDYLKIDGGFVRDITDDPMDRALVESINQIGHVLGIATIAESVEDEATLALLRLMGVDYAQGCGIAAPLPLHRLLEALASQDEHLGGLAG